MLCKALGISPCFTGGNQGSNQGENNEQVARINGLVDGKILTGNHGFYHQIWGFPVNFPLNQSIHRNVGKEELLFRVSGLGDMNVSWM